MKDGVNWYAYCGNNPLIFVDPSGLEPNNHYETDKVDGRNANDTSVSFIYRFREKVGEETYQKLQEVLNPRLNPAHAATLDQMKAAGATEENLRVARIDMAYADLRKLVTEISNGKYDALSDIRFFNSLKSVADYSCDLRAVSLRLSEKGSTEYKLGYIYRFFNPPLDYWGWANKTYNEIRWAEIEGFLTTRALIASWNMSNFEAANGPSRPTYAPEEENYPKNNATVLHKNSNAYIGPQVVYEIRINGQVYKYGKADMTQLSSTGNPVRLQSQINRLQRLYPDSQVTGRVLYKNPSISTQQIKQVETAYIQQYYNMYGTLPIGNPDHPGIQY